MAGTLFAAFSALEHLSTAAFVWLVLAWWVVWWLAAEVVVAQVRGDTGPDGGFAQSR